MAYTKKPKFSYSKLNVYESCGWKYDLIYNKGNYIFTESLASELGTLLHWIEEQVGNAFKAGTKPDYEQLKKDLFELNIPKTSPYDNKGGVFGLNILKEKYKEEFYTPDDAGVSYYTKTLDYATYGMYRMEEYLSANPSYKVFDTEKFFSVEYGGYVFSGYIDRIFYDSETDTYIIEDIKTKGKPFKDTDLVTPMQFVIYTYALSKILDVPYDRIRCCYDLPLCDLRQDAGTPGYVSRGLKRMDKDFARIGAGEFEPSPSPLCHWCQFCPTNPEQQEAGKLLCPYYSLWTRENRTHEVAHKWEGIEKHGQIMELEKREQGEKSSVADTFDFEF